MALTIDEFLAKYTSNQISELMALEKLFPPADQRMEDQLAMLCCFIWNANKGPDTPAKDIEAFRIMYGAEYTYDHRMEAKRQAMVAGQKNMKARCERQGES